MKGRKPFGKSIRKGEKGKTSESNVGAEEGKAERNLTEKRQEKKQTRSRGTNTGRFQSSVQKIRQILSAAPLKTQDNH